MLCLHLKNSDPFYCLAAEEYLLRNFKEEIFMLWQSRDTVVVGKHQCAPAEINYPFLRENHITLARRISGGGTVFHDAGNVNFTFIKNVDSPAEISFKKFTRPIIDSLSRLDIKAVSSGRNDLLVEGKKISGNAEHIFKNRVLHHGTLLFDSDLKNLGQAIKTVPGKYKTKAVQSNRSEVANISGFLNISLTLEEFISLLFEVQLENPENRFNELSERDDLKIEQLADEKFRIWDWNFGYSPKYEFRNELKINAKKLIVELKAEKGIIQESKISGNYFSADDAFSISLRLKDKRHFFEDIQEVLPDLPEEVIYAFF